MRIKLLAIENHSQREQIHPNLRKQQAKIQHTAVPFRHLRDVSEANCQKIIPP